MSDPLENNPEAVCDTCCQPLVYNQHSDGICASCHDYMLGQPPPEMDTHKAVCHEYWERGLNCPCIPQHELNRIAAAVKRGDSVDDIIDPGWGQYD